MRLIAFVIVSLAWALFGTFTASAAVEARIDVKAQKMQVLVDGVQTYEWRVSTARKGYVTPKGDYKPQDMYKKYY